MTQNLANSIALLPYFRGLEAELLARVASISRVRSYGSGDVIFRQGDPCRGFFAIRAGRVRLYTTNPDGREQVVHSLREGQSFAEAALFNFGSYPVHGEAMTSPTELIEVSGKPFLDLFHSEKHLAEAMVGSLCQRLLSLVQRVDELSASSAAARLARHVLRLPSRGTPIEVEIPSAKKDLAALLSITPETLSRLLRNWRENGILETRGRTLVLLDVERLAEIADGG